MLSAENNAKGQSKAHVILLLRGNLWLTSGPSREADLYNLVPFNLIFLLVPWCAFSDSSLGFLGLLIRNTWHSLWTINSRESRNTRILLVVPPLHKRTWERALSLWTNLILGSTAALGCEQQCLVNIVECAVTNSSWPFDLCKGTLLQTGLLPSL